MRPFAIGFLIYFTFLGTTGPYWAIFLRRVIGLSETEVGLVLATYLFAIIGGGFLAGRVSDLLSSRRAVQRATTAVGCTACIAFVFARDLTAAWTLAAILGLSLGGQVPMLDAACIDALGSQRHRYGLIRLFGTIGFGATAFVMGFVRQGRPESIVVAMAISLLLFHGATWKLPDSQPKNVTVPRRFAPLLRHRPLQMVLAAAILHTIGCAPREQFGTLHFESLGIDSPTIGTFYLMGTTAEIGAFLLLPRFLETWRGPQILALAVGATVVRWILLAQITSPWSILATESLHGLTYGAWWVAMVQILGSIVPASSRTSGQALLSMAFAAGMGIGAQIAGRIRDAFDGRATFLVATVAALSELALVFALRRALERPAPTLESPSCPPRRPF